MGWVTYILDGSEVLRRGRRMLLGMTCSFSDDMAFGKATVEAVAMGNDRMRLASVVSDITRRVNTPGATQAEIEQALHDDIRTAIDAITFSADEIKMLLNRAGIKWQGKRMRFGGWIGSDFYLSLEE